MRSSLTRFRLYSKIGLLVLLTFAAGFYGTRADSAPTVAVQEGKQGSEIRVSLATAEVAEASGSDGISSKAARGKATYPTNSQPAAAELDQIIVRFDERTGQAERASIRRQARIEQVRDLGLNRWSAEDRRGLVCRVTLREGTTVSPAAATHANSG